MSQRTLTQKQRRAAISASKNSGLTERGLALAIEITQLLHAKNEPGQVVAMALSWLLADVVCQCERSGRVSHGAALRALEQQALELAPLLAAGPRQLM
jgi:hypothetical protein